MKHSESKSEHIEYDELLKEKLALEKKLNQLRMEHDILVQTNELLKKARISTPKS